ncbi:MAG: hypothetical protein OHK0015_46360 [Chloroflexi bacterium OHK40]
MIWCITTLAALALVLALTILTLPVRSVRFPRIRPGSLLRGCTATMFLAIAVILGLVAWSVALP